MDDLSTVFAPRSALEPFRTELMGVAAAFTLVGAACMIVFVLIVASKTRAPGRYWLLIGAAITILAKQAPLLHRVLAGPMPSLDVLILSSAVSAFGMAIAGVGCVRLALWLRSRHATQSA